MMTFTARLVWSTMLCMLAGVPGSQAQDAATLRARHALLDEKPGGNPFQLPIHIESSEHAGNLIGDIYALVEQPYAVVGPALQGMDHWCDILILHLNVKGCRASTRASGDTLSLYIGGKHDRPSTDSYLLDFHYRVPASGPDYLEVVMDAAQGPFGTSDYRVVLEATALDMQRTFLHLSYAYAYGMLARVAMQGYLATLGRNKVGFTVVEFMPDGRPAVHIGGIRGVVERNTMRYYLAIEAYLGAMSAPVAEQLPKRLNDWYTAVERYPLQLHELERDEYLDMKRAQLKYQEAPAPSWAAH